MRRARRSTRSPSCWDSDIRAVPSLIGSRHSAIPKPFASRLARMKGNALDFSFSGLKTAVLRWFEQRDMTEEVNRRRALLNSTPRPDTEQWLSVTPQLTLDLLASFQATVIEELLRRAVGAAEECDARTVIISGGVACNAGLRAAAQSKRLSWPVYFPSPKLSTDNAAMIAAAAFGKFRRNELAEFSMAAKANLTLA